MPAIVCSEKKTLHAHPGGGKRERKATGTPEAAEPESQRGSPRECNRRAFPIYRGPVPGKGRPERSRDWSRRVGGL